MQKSNIFDQSTKYLKEITTKVHFPEENLHRYSGKTMAFVFLTKFCDVKCSHCFFRSDSEVFDAPREQYEYSNEGFEKLLTFINSTNNGYLSILGGGEPFKKFDYILKLIQFAKTDRLVLVTSGVWATDYETTKDMIFQMYEALKLRKTPTKVVLRISVDKWHLVKIDIHSIYHIIDVFRESFQTETCFELELHGLEKDDSIAKIAEHYPESSITEPQKYLSDNPSLFKVGYQRYRMNFSDSYSISVGDAKLFSSNLKVNLKNPPKHLKDLLTIFDQDIKYNCYGNPSLVQNSDMKWGLDFLISYNGNVTTWGNDQLYDLNNLYLDSTEEILHKLYHNIISYSFLEKGYIYRNKIVQEINPTAVLRSKAIHIRDYAGASLLEEHHTCLYYAIRVLQDYLKEKKITLEDMLELPIELLTLILSSKREVKKQYQHTSYSILQQYMEKPDFNEQEWKDLFHLIHLGHYMVSSEQLYRAITYYNQHASLMIRSIEEVLDSSKDQYVRLNERLTFMKPEAKAICLEKSKKIPSESEVS